MHVFSLLLLIFPCLWAAATTQVWALAPQAGNPTTLANMADVATRHSHIANRELAQKLLQEEKAREQDQDLENPHPIEQLLSEVMSLAPSQAPLWQQLKIDLQKSPDFRTYQFQSLLTYAQVFYLQHGLILEDSFITSINTSNLFINTQMLGIAAARPTDEEVLVTLEILTHFVETHKAYETNFGAVSSAFLAAQGLDFKAFKPHEIKVALKDFIRLFHSNSSKRIPNLEVSLAKFFHTHQKDPSTDMQELIMTFKNITLIENINLFPEADDDMFLEKFLDFIYPLSITHLNARVILNLYHENHSMQQSLMPTIMSKILELPEPAISITQNTYSPLKNLAFSLLNYACHARNTDLLTTLSTLLSQDPVVLPKKLVDLTYQLYRDNLFQDDSTIPVEQALFYTETFFAHLIPPYEGGIDLAKRLENQNQLVAISELKAWDQEADDDAHLTFIRRYPIAAALLPSRPSCAKEETFWIAWHIHSLKDAWPKSLTSSHSEQAEQHLKLLSALVFQLLQRHHLSISHLDPFFLNYELSYGLYQTQTRYGQESSNSDLFFEFSQISKMFFHINLITLTMAHERMHRILHALDLSNSNQEHYSAHEGIADIAGYSIISIIINALTNPKAPIPMEQIEHLDIWLNTIAQWDAINPHSDHNVPSGQDPLSPKDSSYLEKHWNTQLEKLDEPHDGGRYNLKKWISLLAEGALDIRDVFNSYEDYQKSSLEDCIAKGFVTRSTENPYIIHLHDTHQEIYKQHYPDLYKIYLALHFLQHLNFDWTIFLNSILDEREIKPWANTFASMIIQAIAQSKGIDISKNDYQDILFQHWSEQDLSLEENITRLFSLRPLIFLLTNYVDKTFMSLHDSVIERNPTKPLSFEDAQNYKNMFALIYQHPTYEKSVLYKKLVELINSNNDDNALLALQLIKFLGITKQENSNLFSQLAAYESDFVLPDSPLKIQLQIDGLLNTILHPKSTHDTTAPKSLKTYAEPLSASTAKLLLAPRYTMQDGRKIYDESFGQNASKAKPQESQAFLTQYLPARSSIQALLSQDVLKDVAIEIYEDVGLPVAEQMANAVMNQGKTIRISRSFLNFLATQPQGQTFLEHLLREELYEIAHAIGGSFVNAEGQLDTSSPRFQGEIRSTRFSLEGYSPAQFTAFASIIDAWYSTVELGEDLSAAQVKQLKSLADMYRRLARLPQPPSGFGLSSTALSFDASKLNADVKSASDIDQIVANTTYVILSA